MRDRMERLVILPFSFGCVSEATVAVGTTQPRRSRPDTNSQAATTKGPKDISESMSGESMRNLLKFHEDVPKSNTHPSFNRLLKGFKNLPQLFVDKEKVEMEMEIGCPTNVQHVTHIGWDGTGTGTGTATSSESIMGWKDAVPPPPHLLQQFNLEPKPGTLSSSSPMKQTPN
ncbi:CRIB domain-containing protein RIC4-like [Abrus precatorius]|uniref:CRIB domain-containing protein RIC4-like n=1 Tax=Abrus precatorius TaxID=3816 RepID=A0A8B8M9U2_ABRPR|nr:CRIB domain-containing protein RIC4-like [Abrus precatorius]